MVSRLIRILGFVLVTWAFVAWASTAPMSAAYPSMPQWVVAIWAWLLKPPTL